MTPLSCVRVFRANFLNWSTASGGSFRPAVVVVLVVRLVLSAAAAAAAAVVLDTTAEQQRANMAHGEREPAGRLIAQLLIGVSIGVSGVGIAEARTE